MARIRSVKPEFFDDPDLAADLTPTERLVYIGLWVMCFDNWTMEYDPRKVRRTLFGYDEDIDDAQVSVWVERIIETGRAVRFDHEGRTCLYLPKCAEHQVVNRPSKSPIPQPSSDGTHAPLTEDSPTEGSREGSREQGAGSVDAPPPRSNFPRCFAEEIERDGKTLSFRGHLLRDLERYAGTWPSIPKNQGKLGAAITEGCPPDCQGDKARRCASQLIVHAKTLHEEFTAKSEPFPVELFLYKCREGAR